MRVNSYGKNLLAIFAGLLLILLLEGVLAVTGVTPLAEEDPFVGFSGTSPLFIEQSPGSFTLNPAKADYFNTPQTFAMPKPAGTFRIVVFGGSTTYGRPYRHATSFGAWLGKLIERYGDDGYKIEVINAGGISYASYRVRRLMDEMALYDPDLFIVYSGHNEFLEARTFADLREESETLRRVRALAQKSRLYSALARGLGRVYDKNKAPTTLGDKVSATLERIGGPNLYHRDAQFRAGVIRQYDHEIRSMVDFCKSRNIPLLLSTLPVNLSAISPFKSEYSRQLSPQELQAWNRAYAQGVAALEKGDPAGSLVAFAEAEAIDDGFADLHYRKGKAHELLGAGADAYRDYDRAREEDIVPLRALNEFNRILRSVAAAERIPLADVEQVFLNISPQGIPGANLFVDHVHPSIEGHQLVAWVMMDAATQARLVPLDSTVWRQVMPQARDFLQQELLKIPERYQAEGIRGVGRLYFWAGKYPEAYSALTRAWQTIKDKPETARQLGELELMRGDISAALAYLNAAEVLSPGDRKVALARASALNRSEKSADALEILRKIEIPDNDEAAGVYHLFGETLLLLDRPLEAADYYRKAVAAAPDVADYRLFLAKSLKQGGDKEAARQAYSSYLALLANPGLATPLETWLLEP